MVSLYPEAGWSSAKDCAATVPFFSVPTITITIAITITITIVLPQLHDQPTDAGHVLCLQLRMMVALQVSVNKEVEAVISSGEHTQRSRCCAATRLAVGGPAFLKYFHMVVSQNRGTRI